MFRYFTKRQRIGVLLLFLIVIVVQLLLFSVSTNDFLSNGFDDNTLAILDKEYNVLHQKKLKKKTPKRYPFNPNFITLYKGYELGMSLEEIERLHAFRAQNKWINSSQDFQKVTGISDSLLAAISPYFKFPKWVTQSSQNNTYKPKKISKLDLNLATAEELQKVYGVGSKLSERILRYREKYDGGFANMIELSAIYGLSEDVIENIKKKFIIAHPRPIHSVDLNTANQEDLVKIPFIDYELAYRIIETRVLKEVYFSIEELTKIKDFPTNRLDIIKLYLYIK